MSKPSFTFCSRMVVEYERVVNLLRYIFGLWIFYKIFIFFFFSDHFVSWHMSIKSEPFYDQFQGYFAQISMANTLQVQDQSHFVQVYMANLHENWAISWQTSLSKTRPPLTYELKYTFKIFYSVFSIKFKWRPIRPKIKEDLAPNLRPFAANSSVNQRQTRPPQSVPFSARIQSWNEIRVGLQSRPFSATNSSVNRGQTWPKNFDLPFKINLCYVLLTNLKPFWHHLTTK